MFACVSNDDDDSVTGISRRGGKRQVEQEDELINKVLEEGLRLKKRCKALTTALSDADSRAIAQREADQKGYQETIFKVQQQIDLEASRLASAHTIELSHLCDTKNREIDELHRQLERMSSELNVRVPIHDQLSKSVKYERDLQRYLVEHELEKKRLIMERDDAADEYRSSMLKRALLAENEVQRLAEELRVVQESNQQGLISTSDSVQSQSFAADISNLKDLLERGKADLFLESKARAQLAAECQSLTALLTERTKERDMLIAEIAAEKVERLGSRKGSLTTRMSCEFLGGEKRVQEAVHKAPLPSGTERQVEKEIEVNSASDAKVGLAHLEEVRGKLQNRCCELEIELKDARGEIKGLESSVSELLEGKSAVTVAVSAVQMENKKLKSELAELFKMKDLIDKDYSQRRVHGFKKEKELVDRERIKEWDKEKMKERDREQEKRDVCKRLEKQEREIELRRVRGEDAGWEGKEVRGIAITTAELHLVSPATPVSFVSRAICQIEGKSPLPVRVRSQSVSPIIRASGTYATTNYPAINSCNGIAGRGVTPPASADASGKLEMMIKTVRQASTEASDVTDNTDDTSTFSTDSARERREGPRACMGTRERDVSEGRWAGGDRAKTFIPKHDELRGDMREKEMVAFRNQPICVTSAVTAGRNRDKGNERDSIAMAGKDKNKERSFVGVLSSVNCIPSLVPLFPVPRTIQAGQGHQKAKSEENYDLLGAQSKQSFNPALASKLNLDTSFPPVAGRPPQLTPRRKLNSPQ